MRGELRVALWRWVVAPRQRNEETKQLIADIQLLQQSQQDKVGHDAVVAFRRLLIAFLCDFCADGCRVVARRCWVYRSRRR